jgi:membrane-bound lytic murein transglycosylase MltF
MKPTVHVLVLVACLIGACSKSPSPTTQPSTPPPAAATAAAPAAAALPPDIISGSAALPIKLTRRTGDLDVMMRARRIRALILVNRTEFFYDKGVPRGISYESLEEFQRFLNAKFKTGSLPTTIAWIPVHPEQLEAALLQGVGDLIATGVFITPERLQRVLFTAPIATGIKEVIVSGPTAPALTSTDDLSGVAVYANPLTVAYQALQRLSTQLQRQRKPAIEVHAADNNLAAEDLLEMVDAGLIPATVTSSRKAEFWSTVFPHLTVHQDIVAHEDGELAWVLRQDSPKLKQVLDEFIAGHGAGSAFGNTLLRRYLQIPSM